MAPHARALALLLPLALPLPACQTPPRPDPYAHLPGWQVRALAGGHFYSGQVSASGAPHGQGVVTFMRGTTVIGNYDGAFVNGQAHDPGTATFSETAAVHRVMAERGCVQVGESWMAIGTKNCPAL